MILTQKLTKTNNIYSIKKKTITINQTIIKPIKPKTQITQLKEIINLCQIIIIKKS